MQTQIGADGVFNIGGAPSMRTFNLSTPAGWAMLYWGAAAFLIFMMLWLA
jgi:hypothetical protein